MAERRRQPSPSLRRQRSRRLCAVLLVLLAGYLYAGPVRSYLDARSHTAKNRQEFAGLSHEHAQLTAQLRALRTPAKLTAVARGDGYIVPGETPYSLQFSKRP